MNNIISNLRIFIYICELTEGKRKNTYKAQKMLWKCSNNIKKEKKRKTKLRNRIWRLETLRMSLQVTYLLCRGLGPVYTFLLSAPKTWSPSLCAPFPWRSAAPGKLKGLNSEAEEAPLNLWNLAFPAAAWHGVVLKSKSRRRRSRKRIRKLIFWFLLFTQIIA